MYDAFNLGSVFRGTAATGCSAIDLIERDHGSAGTGSGFSAVRTCNLPWRRDYLAARHQGEFLYWRDVMNGFWVTGALDQKVGALSK